MTNPSTMQAMREKIIQVLDEQGLPAKGYLADAFIEALFPDGAQPYEIHSCSPFCERPACIKDRERKAKDEASAEPVAWYLPMLGSYAFIHWGAARPDDGFINGYKPLYTHAPDSAAEIARLSAELADALDVKNGKGPTALSMVLAERDQLHQQLHDATARLEAAEKEMLEMRRSIINWREIRYGKNDNQTSVVDRSYPIAAAIAAQVGTVRCEHQWRPYPMSGDPSRDICIACREERPTTKG